MTSAAIPIHQFEVEVHIFDTDCYGIMWHGAYTKWTEMGRVNLCRSVGMEIAEPMSRPESFLFPVLEQTMRYRSPARLGDTLLVETTVQVESYKLVFKTVFRNKETGKLVVEGLTTIVILTPDWQLCRKIPPHIAALLQVNS